MKKTIDLVWKSLLLTVVLLNLNSVTHGQGFTIYNSWNFENNSLGKYTDDQIRKDFNVVTNYSHNSADIVSDVINGQTTKVLRITHPAGGTSLGFDLDAKIAQDFDEVYLSYNFKFSNEFNSTSGGKLPGLGGLPVVTANHVPTRDQGFLCKHLFKQAGKIITYHYDRTPPAYPNYMPWATETQKFRDVYMANGTWYNITQRLKMNSFTNGKPNGDGINEVWVNGHMVFQETNLVLMEVQSADLKIDDLNIAHFYGGSSVNYAPLTQSYGYIDNLVIWKPTNDPVQGYALHNPGAVLQTPSTITDRRFYYDELRTTQGTLKNSQYGSTYSNCIDEAYLIDAGEGRKVNFNITAGSIGSGDYLFIYDGNTADAQIIDIIIGYNSAITRLRSSTGRYMFIRFSSNTEGGTAGWTGNITFSGSSAASLHAPSNLNLSSFSSGVNLSWTDNCTVETGYKIERSSTSGTGFQTINTTGASNTNYIDNNVTVGQRYYYRISAFNSTQQSNFCDEKSILFSPPSGTVVNVARGKTVRQSSTLYAGVPERAIDGNTSGSWNAGSVTHTAADLNSWWEIDLQQVYSLSSIEIWNRTDECCAGRLINYYVFVSDIPFSSTNLTTTLNQSGVWKQYFSSYPNPMQSVFPSRTGRYIRIQSSGNTELNLAEIIVKAPAQTIPAAPSSLSGVSVSSSEIKLSWKDNASDESGFRIERYESGGFKQVANVSANTTSYSDKNLTASTTYTYRVAAYNAQGVSGFSNQASAKTDAAPVIMNVAIGKPVKQSSTRYSGVPQRAVDGNKNGSWSEGSVSHTGPDMNSWWEIDLGSSYKISNIEIWNRTDLCCSGRLVNYYVIVSDIPFTSINLQTTLNQSGIWKQYYTNYPNPMQLVNPGRTGRYIRIQCSGTTELNLAEVIINAQTNVKDELTSSADQFISEDRDISIFPNPASTQMTIEYQVYNDSRIYIGLYSINGALTEVLVDEYKKPGKYSEVFDLGKTNNRIMPGIYMIVFRNDKEYLTRKVIINN